MVAWLFLTIGLALGGLWAYEELGWGGYWGWDPVENAGLLPWFTATAFLHSVIVQERRSMLKVWNVALVIVTFFLTIFGTFMTRSGVVQSVHAFGEDKELAWMFTVFMVAMVTVSFGWLIYRLPLLRARHTLDSWVSREAAFLANNWVLLFSAFFVLFATMFPTLSEAVRGERLTVGPEFFNKWMKPIGLILLFLTGVGPLLGWRKSTLVNLRNQFLWPTLSALTVGGGMRALGVAVWASGLCFALCAFVTVTILQEFYRAAAVRHDTTGTDLFTALVGLFARERRRYGGYVIHLGIVLVFLGFAGNGFGRNEELKLNPGQQVELKPYVVKYVALTVTDDGQKQMITGHMEVERNGKPYDSMYPARWFYRKHESEPTTEVAIRRSIPDDLYIVLAEYNVDTQTAVFKIVINPLIDWIWLGMGVILIGTLIALLPEKAIVYATGRVPEGAATTTLLILLLVAGSAVQLRAQHVESGQTVLIVPKSPVERELQSALVCMCGTCGRKRIGECTCNVAGEMREEVARLVASGMSRDQVIDYFVKKYGSQEVLQEPIDKGFNRLAWLLPYGVGAAGVVGVGLIAVRWSRRPNDETQAAPGTPIDPDLESKLDDELRDLD
jgi:cytochrome c-type biogenesis protein CcmF